MSSTTGTEIATAIERLQGGDTVVLRGDRGALAGDFNLLVSAEKATPLTVAFMIRHTSGFLRAVLTAADSNRLDLPLMYSSEQPLHSTAYAVTVDAHDEVTTGISATDRCTTLRLLADPATVASQLSRPGHVVPVRANDHGLIRRAGYAEAVVDILRIAGLRPVGALCELVSDQGAPMTAEQVEAFCSLHGVPMVSVASIVEHRLLTEKMIDRIGEAHLDMAHCPLVALSYRSRLDNQTHIALCSGRLSADAPPEVHLRGPGASEDSLESSATRETASPQHIESSPAVVVYFSGSSPWVEHCGSALPQGVVESVLLEQILVDLGLHQVRLSPETAATVLTERWTRVTTVDPSTEHAGGRANRLTGSPLLPAT